MNNLTNIKSTGFNVTNTESEAKRVLIKLPVSGTFTFSQFALAQLTKAAFPVLKEQSLTRESQLALLQKIVIYGIDWTDNQVAPLSYDEVKTLIHWLSKRMQHCERERDEELKNMADPSVAQPANTGFNQDTYITMKLLLLELKEWSLGTIMEG